MVIDVASAGRVDNGRFEPDEFSSRISPYNMSTISQPAKGRRDKCDSECRAIYSVLVYEWHC